MPDTDVDLSKYLQEKMAPSNDMDLGKYLKEKTGKDADYDWAGAPSRVLRSASESARSGLEAATLGASEPVISGMNAATDTLTGKNPISLDELKKNYQADVERRRQYKKDAPVSDIGGQALGYLSPVGPAAAVGEKVGGLVAKGADALLPEAPAAASKLGQAASNLYGNTANAAKAAAQGSAGALAQEAPRQVVEGSTGFIQKGDKNVPDLGSVASTGAGMGAGMSAAGTAARGLGAAGAATGKKLMAAFLGPSEDHIDYYLKNPEAVNGAKSMEELKDKVDGITDKLREDVQNGSKSIEDAKSDLRDVEQAVADHRRQSSFDYQVTATQVKQSFRDAKDDLDKAFQSKVQDLKNVKAPTDLADEAVQATKDLKGKIVEGSKDARNLLDNSSRDIELYSPYKALQAAKDKLNIAGKGPVTPQAKAASAAIDGLMAAFGSIPGGKLSGSDAKSLIQQLDQSEQAIYNSGEFTDDVSRAYKTLRQEIDTQLKAQNPEYAAAMKPVAENTALHSNVQPAFGDRQSAISKLNSIATPANTTNRENLAKLGQATGRDFTTPVAEHVKAQGILKSPEALENIKQGLPEFQRAQDAEKANRMLEGPEAKAEYIQNNLNNSGLLKQQAAKEGLLAQKQQGLVKSQGMLEPFKNINPNSSEARLKTVMNARPGEQVELTRQLEDLSKASDTDFIKALKDLKTQRAFKGQDTNGSRKVNLFGMIVGGVTAGAAGLMGHGILGAEVGVPIGATMGAVADKYGPAISKKMLDAAIKIKGSPTLAKIQSLEVPPQVKAALARELADYND